MLLKKAVVKKCKNRVVKKTVVKNAKIVLLKKAVVKKIHKYNVTSPRPIH